MNKILICTTGTSIAGGCPSLKAMQQGGVIYSWNHEAPELERELREKIDGIDLNDGKARRKLSAELNSIDRIGVSENDDIILLASDTADGRICTEANRKILLDVYSLKEHQVRVAQVQCLQVKNAEKLRTDGLKNLVNIVWETINHEDSSRNSEIILNPTGGFKGVVPFLTIVGMLLGKRSVYIFEHAEELINLPPLPVSFNIDAFERARPAFEHIDKNVAVHVEEYLGKIRNFDKSERELFLSFTEPMDGDKVTLSTLAHALLKIDNDGERPMISEDALKTLEGIKGESAGRLKRMLIDASSPLRRSDMYHTFSTTDLMVLKKPHTKERVAGFMKNRRFHIVLVFDDHDEYERTLHKKSKKDFADREFVEYDPCEDEASVSSDVEVLQDELFRARQEIGEAQDNARKSEDKAFELEVKLVEKSDELKSQEAEWEKRVQQIGQEAEKLRAKVEQLQAELSAATQSKPEKPRKGLFSRLFGWGK